MPELPEVQTTVNGLIETIVGLKIADVWSDYESLYWRGSGNIKDPAYFKLFKRAITGETVKSVSRRAKNILIHLESGDIILVHMKMTGHLLFGVYEYSKKSPKWIPVQPDALKDPFNRHIHFVLTFENGKRLALCDSRKFAKVTLIKLADFLSSSHLTGIGPEPLSEDFSFEVFLKQIYKKPEGKIKQVLTDQSVIAGIGNIYADESLFRSGIHPLVQTKNIPAPKLKELYQAIKKTLRSGIDLGGDSMSDYRNVHGERGKFQEKHLAYQRTGERCSQKNCRGTITRISLGGRGTHFCNYHQKIKTAEISTVKQPKKQNTR